MPVSNTFYCLVKIFSTEPSRLPYRSVKDLSQNLFLAPDCPKKTSFAAIPAISALEDTCIWILVRAIPTPDDHPYRGLGFALHLYPTWRKKLQLWDKIKIKIVFSSSIRRKDVSCTRLVTKRFMIWKTLSLYFTVGVYFSSLPPYFDRHLLDRWKWGG